MPASPKHTSPLSSADAAFRLLTQGPDPLSLDGTAISGALPQRLIPLDELKRILLRASTDGETRDAAWSALIAQARNGGPAWMVGAVGVAMPALRRVAGQLARGYDLDTAADIDSEVLTGFLSAVRSLGTQAAPPVPVRHRPSTRPRRVPPQRLRLMAPAARLSSAATTRRTSPGNALARPHASSLFR